MKHNNNNRGITLIELLIVMAITTIIAAAASGVVILGMKTYNTNFSLAANQGTLRAAMLAINSRAHSSDTVSAPGNVLTMNGLTYSLESGSLKSTDSAGTKQTIATGISAFTVSVNSKIITVTITGTYGTISSTLTAKLHAKP